jgi:hypothetical protein
MMVGLRVKDASDGYRIRPVKALILNDKLCLDVRECPIE